MAGFSTIPVQGPCLSTETTERLEDTLNPAVRAAPIPARLAHTTTAETQGASRQAVEVASAEDFTGVEADSTAAVVVIGNRRLVISPVT
jgi:hypothetical protein